MLNLTYLTPLFRVNDKYVVKVADFGLSRDVADDVYYVDSHVERPKPYRWMAVESLTERKFSEKTDVVNYKARIILSNNHSIR